MNSDQAMLIAGLNLSDNSLAFIWAAYEQEKLWLSQDAAFVDCASRGWTNNTGGFDDSTAYRMLASYGLLRGKRGTVFAGKNCAERIRNRDQFMQLAHSHAAELKADQVVNNTQVWKSLGRELANRVGYNLANGNWFMPSATLKVMWFHRPSIIPMYDSYVCKALRVRESKFLNKFMLNYQNCVGHIEDAKRSIGSIYPYNIRIMDKFLWLKGSGSQYDILQNFQTGCRMLCDA